MRLSYMWTSVMGAALSARPRHARSRRKLRQHALRFERLERKTLLAADLTLDISDGGVSVDPGGTVVYSFEYANIGDSAATGAALHTTVPAHTSFAAESSSAAWSCSAGRFSWSRNSCTLELGDVEAGAMGTVSFAVSVDSELSPRVHEISNFGYISSDADGRDRNDFGAAFTPIMRPFHDLQLDLSDGDTDASPGGTIVYALDYTNGGNADAPGATISVNLPARTTFSAESSSDGWTCDEMSCSLSVGDVPAGGGGTVTIGVVLDGDVPTSVRRIHASAMIADDGSGAADRSRRNNFDVESTSVVHRLPDLTIALDDGDAGVAPGESIVYAMDYANEGTFDATGVAITIMVPRHTSFDAENSSAGWSCEERVCTLAVGNLASGSADTATFAVLVDADVPAHVRRIYASASIADDGSAGGDANRRNNRAFERITIQRALPDVSLQIDDGGTNVAPGGSIVYTLNYTNTGTLDATGAVIQLKLPRQATFTTEGSSEGWACADGRCTLEVGNIAAGESGTATLAVTVDADLSPRTRRIYAVARISDDGMNGRDANRFNNYAFARTPIDRG